MVQIYLLKTFSEKAAYDSPFELTPRAWYWPTSVCRQFVMVRLNDLASDFSNLYRADALSMAFPSFNHSRVKGSSFSVTRNSAAPFSTTVADLGRSVK